jgi:hypothetical protein
MSGIKSWPIEEPKKDGKTCDPEQRAKYKSPAQSGGFVPMIIKKVVKS